MTTRRPETPGGSAVSRETSRAFCVRDPEVEPSRTLASVVATAWGEDRWKPAQRRESEHPGGEKTQESYALGLQLKQLDRVADSGVEQHPEGVETPRGERRWKQRTAAREEEGSGGWPQERIRHETRPGGSGRMKAPGGCENLKAQAVGKACPTNSCRCPALEKRWRGRNLKGGAASWRTALGAGRRVTGKPGTQGSG